jgi:hypothetical protein
MGSDLTIKINQIKSKLIDFKKKYSLKYIIFTLGNTRVLNSRNYYFTPFRKGNDFILCGAIVFSETEGEIILKALDGIVDIFYVDCEKKSIKYEHNNGLYNLERLSQEIIVNSKLRYYKGNDLTVNTIDSLVVNILKKKNKLVGGSNILIVGLGNLGFKTSLRLVERGAHVFVLSSDLDKGKLLAKSINIVKPKETISKVKIFDNININKLDVIILCHLSSIEKYSDIYFNTNKDCSFIDVGKGCLTKNQISFLNNRNNYCLRLDIGDTILDYIINDMKYAFKNFQLPKTKKINNISLISKGLIGKKGEIVVDDVDNPKFIYGICDGFGGLQKVDDENKILSKIL